MASRDDEGLPRPRQTTAGEVICLAASASRIGPAEGPWNVITLRKWNIARRNGRKQTFSLREPGGLGIVEF